MSEEEGLLRRPEDDGYFFGSASARLSEPLPSVRRTDPDTSHAAAVHRPGRVTQRGRLLDEIQGRANGATNDELEQATGIRLNSLTRRVTDLKELGFIRDSGQRRQASSGSAQIVWVAV